MFKKYLDNSHQKPWKRLIITVFKIRLSCEGNFVRRKAFTLVELLVIIAVIGILISILMPSLLSAREKTRRAVCLSNLSQSHIANTLYGKNNNSELPGGNAVVDTSHGVGSTHIVNENKPMGASIPYALGYLSSPRVFFCPSWTHKWKQINKMDDNGRFGGYYDNGEPGPTRHIMTSLNYRGVFEGEVRPPSLMLDDSSVAYMSDHWTTGWGKMVHLKEGYNTLFVDGHAKFKYDKGQSLILTRINNKNDQLQDQYWMSFFND